MSLERYRSPRMVVLHPSTSVYAAARAMADNHIGSILVGERHQLEGIVTDRDLALEVIGGSLSHTTPLHDVMSDELATVPIAAGVDDVVRTMCERGCRRVPVVEDGKPVGLVTLDDLLLEGAIDAATARLIVAAQLEAAARFKDEDARSPEVPSRPARTGRRDRAILRRKARAESTYGRLLHAVEAHSGLEMRDQAERALLVVLGMLCRRVTPDEARHFIAQLPSKLHAELERNLDGPDRRVTAEAIEAELMRLLGVGDDAARMLLSSVCEAVAEGVTAGEIESLRGQLPLDMKDLFPPTPFRRCA